MASHPHFIVESEDSTMPKRLANMLRQRGATVLEIPATKSVSEVLGISNLSYEKTIQKARRRGSLLLRNTDVLLIHGEQLMSILAANDMRRIELFLRKRMASDLPCGGLRLFVVAKNRDKVHKLVQRVKAESESRDRQLYSVLDRIDFACA